MPRTNKAEAKVAFESEMFTSRRAELGDFTVGELARTLAVLEGNITAAAGRQP